MQRTIITITGPSLSGKTTLARELINTGRFVELVSTTTRQPRAGEVHGIAYYFVTDAEFERCLFVERINFNGAKYGMTVAEVERGFATGKQPVVVCEPDGCNQIALYAKAIGWRHLKIFITNPLNVRIDRFMQRFAQEGDLVISAPKYASRLKVMLTEEQCWEDSRVDWDLRIGRFDPETTLAVVTQVTGLVGSIQ